MHLPYPFYFLSAPGKNFWPGICLDIAGRYQAAVIFVAIPPSADRQSQVSREGSKSRGFPLNQGFGAQGKRARPHGTLST